MYNNYKETSITGTGQWACPRSLNLLCAICTRVNYSSGHTWLFNSLQHIYMTGWLKQQCMVTIQKQKCLQALRPHTMLPLGYQCCAWKHKVTCWWGIAGVSQWNVTWAKQITLKFEVLPLKLNIPLITKLIIFIEIKSFLHCYLFLLMHVVCCHPNNGNHLQSSGQLYETFKITRFFKSDWGHIA